MYYSVDFLLNKIYQIYLPGTGPQTLGMISKIAEQDGSSKHNCLAKMQFRIAIAVFMFWPAKIRKINGKSFNECNYKI